MNSLSVMFSVIKKLLYISIFIGLTIQAAGANKPDIAGTWEYVHMRTGHNVAAKELQKIEFVTTMSFSWVRKERNVGSVQINTLLFKNNKAKPVFEYYGGYFLLTKTGTSAYMIDFFVSKEGKEKNTSGKIINYDTKHSDLRLKFLDFNTMEISGPKRKMVLRRIKN